MIRRLLARVPLSSVVIIALLGSIILTTVPAGLQDGSAAAAVALQGAAQTGPSGSNTIPGKAPAPLSLSRVVSVARDAGSGLRLATITFTIANTQPFNGASSDARIRPSRAVDWLALRDVVLTDRLLDPSSIVIKATPTPRRRGAEVVWRLRDIAPSRHVTVTLTLALRDHGTAMRRVALDQGATAWGVRDGRLITVKAAASLLGSGAVVLAAQRSGMPALHIAARSGMPAPRAVIYCTRLL